MKVRMSSGDERYVRGETVIVSTEPTAYIDDRIPRFNEGGVVKACWDPRAEACTGALGDPWRRVCRARVCANSGKVWCGDSGCLELWDCQRMRTKTQCRS